MQSELSAAMNKKISMPEQQQKTSRIDADLFQSKSTSSSSSTAPPDYDLLGLGDICDSESDGEEEQQLAASKGALQCLPVASRPSPPDWDARVARLPRAKAGMLLPTLFVFDWDDTLFPTSWLRRNAHVERGTLWDSMMHSSLDVHTHAVAVLLRQALSLGEVVVVTLADRKWVVNSIRRYMPELAPLLFSLRIYCAGDRTPCTEALQPAAKKRDAMMRAMADKAADAGQAAMCWGSLVSVGDSSYERLAAQNVGACGRAQGFVKWTKCVKLGHRPTLIGLCKNLLDLAGRLEGLVTHPGDMDTYL